MEGVEASWDYIHGLGWYAFLGRLVCFVRPVDFLFFFPPFSILLRYLHLFIVCSILDCLSVMMK